MKAIIAPGTPRTPGTPAIPRTPAMPSRARSQHRIRKSTAALLGATALALPLTAPGAFAQAAADQATVDTNTIIVTAQRRSEALENVPMSVSVVTAQNLTDAGVNNLRDLSNVTSGYQLGAGGAFPQPAIRGVTTEINGSFENNVAVYVDGLYQTVAQTLAIDLPNVESIQVLKGPQGTLYGRNATGGALLLTTITPSKEWEGKAELTYAEYNDKRASGYVAGPISDFLGISLAGYIRRSDGYMKLASRTTPGATSCCAVPIDQDAIRAKLKFNFSDAFHATVMYNFTRVNDSSTNVYSPIENVTKTYLLPGGATRPTTLGVEAYDLGDFMDVKQHEGGLVLDLDAGIGTLKSITGYSKTTTDNRFDFDGSYIPLSYSSAELRERTFQQSLDFTVNAIRHVDLIVGGNYFHDKLDYQPGLPQTNYSGIPSNYLVNPGITPGSINDYTVASQSYLYQTKNAWAVYGDLTFHLTDKLSINAGGRYSHEKQDILAYAVSSNPAAVRPQVTPSATFAKFTPRASIRYELAPRTNIYASYSQGFRSGAFSSQVPACVLTVGPSCYTPAQQETIKAYEIGLKTAQPGFHFELAGFYYDYRNLQVSTTKTVNGFPFVDITNAPKAKIYGADASFEVKPIENLTLRASGTYLHARYGSGFYFSGVGAQATGTGGGVGINTNADVLKTYYNVNQIQDLSHLQMARAPTFTGNIGGDYMIPIGEGGIRLAANVKYTTSYVVTNPSIWCQGTPLTISSVTYSYDCSSVPAARQREQRFREGAFALVSASITWTDPSDHFYVRGWVNNLTDHRYRLHYSGTSSFGTYSPMAEPRVFGGTIGFKFHEGPAAPPPPPPPAASPTAAAGSAAPAAGGV